MNSKLTILHLIHDDKFFDSLFELFDETETINHYVIFNEPFALKFITKRNYVDFIPRTPENLKKLKNANYNIIIIHFLHSFYKYVIPYFPVESKVLWLPWGSDLYQLVNFNLYQNRTLKLKRKYDKSIWLNFISSIKENKLKILNNDINIKKVIPRIDFCSTVVPTEFEILAKRKWFRAKQVEFNYPFPKSFNLNNIFPENDTNDSILVGNSFTWTNNHADVFIKLRNLGIFNKKIIVPLNYGIDINKNKWFLDFGYDCFGDNFFPITQYLTIEEYDRIIGMCNVCIFNSERQQAVGNIIMMMSKGSKIFLSENSPTYKYFKQLGLIVFSFQNDLNQININKSLTYEEKMINLQYVKNNWTFEANKTKLMNTLSIISSK